jgi:hypothetical protein
MAIQEPPGSGGPRPTFPQRNAFVLQFAADAGPQTGLARGRIQHVTTGEQVLFESTEELWAFVRDVLAGGFEDDGAPRPKS